MGDNKREALRFARDSAVFLALRYAEAIIHGDDEEEEDASKALLDFYQRLDEDVLEALLGGVERNITSKLGRKIQ